MIFIDANLLLYACDSHSPHHSAARRWLERTLSGPEPAALSCMGILAFLRLSTGPRAFRRPLTISEAIEIIAGWLEDARFTLLQPRGAPLGDPATRPDKRTGNSRKRRISVGELARNPNSREEERPGQEARATCAFPRGGERRCLPPGREHPRRYWWRDPQCVRGCEPQRSGSGRAGSFGDFLP